MKKIFMLIVLLTAYSNIFAFLTQANWRWRNDDGSETTATWKEAQNTPFTQSTTGEIFRLRLEVYNNLTTSENMLDTLQYATSITGPWTNIDTLEGSNAFMISTSSAFVVQDEPTTAQLTGVALPFSAGKIMVDSAILRINLPTQQRTECEWVIKGTTNIAPNTTYFFRQWGAAANNLDIGMTYPSLTTAVVLPIKLNGFTVSRENNKVRVQWATASEQNNDRFDIQRSSDGSSWATIASVKGKGTSAVSNTYSIYDERPLSGNNYYVIKQFDLDGHFSLSEVKFTKMPKAKSIISVYPNPSRTAINFSIVNSGASNVEAVLTNVNGSIVHHEIFKTVPANANIKLNLLKKPAPGVYVLKLNADGLSESVKVVIE
ncbi:MAG: T9SS type A sorting domain-containing protein [Ferruginibacter sp.]